MEIQENVPIGRKTTMRIGGNARYYAEPASKEEVEQVVAFAKEKNIPLIVLGGGSNTIFADGTIEALVVRLKNDHLIVEGSQVTTGASKILAVLINELAEHDLDLSSQTGILGTVGGAVYGNAGQGPKGLWLGSFIDSVTVYIDGKWKTMNKEECEFAYRESAFKHMSPSPIIWETTMTVPSRPKVEVKAEVQRLLKQRLETQPHIKTAGSCFKAVDGTPAWKLIDAAGLRGLKIGGVEIAEKHANFLLNTGEATFADAKQVVEEVRKKVDSPLEVEMRFIDTNGQQIY